MLPSGTLERVVMLSRLRAIRERKALTQDELAELAGVSRQTVVKIEGGLEPRLPTVRKLAEALGVEPSELIDQIAIRFSDATERTISVDWRVQYTAEFRLTIYREGSSEPEKPALAWMSLGASRYPQTHRFHELEPGIEYRIVAESLGQVAEVVERTRPLQA